MPTYVPVRWRERALTLAILLIPVAGSTPAVAQDASRALVQDHGAASQLEPSPPGYDAAIDRALDEHERGNFAEAREHFRAAHQMFPNARTLRGLGKVEYELRDYTASVRLLGEALRCDVRPLDDALRAEVEDLLDRARDYVGTLRLRVEPAHATVSVDGVQNVAHDAPLELSVGEHVLDFRATGHLSERRQLFVRGREELPVSVQLTPLLASPAPVIEPPRDPAPRQRRAWMIWGGASLLVAGAAAAIAVAATRDDPESLRGSTGVTLRNP